MTENKTMTWKPHEMVCRLHKEALYCVS